MATEERGAVGSEDRLDEMEQRLERLEGRPGGLERPRRLASELVPQETRQHLRAAVREQMLATRSLLDHWIGRLRDEPPDQRPGREDIRID
jgi:hypothetical protein